MSREIKFRAFENENARNRMFQWDEIKKHFSDYSNCNDTFLMQFTGLKDKNGIEIYEDDILKINFKEYYINDSVTVDEESEILGKVSFHSGGWFVEEKDSTWFYIYDILDYSDLEVIGNIHENQELL